MNAKTRTMLGAALAAFALPFAALADTDAYGNEIRTYTEGGVQKTYRFWYPSQRMEVMTAVGTSTAVFASSDTFETRNRTWLFALGRICSLRWVGTVFTVR